jgi:hypothetical protein
VVWTHLKNDAAFNTDISRAEDIRLNMIDKTWSNFVTNPPGSSEFTGGLGECPRALMLMLMLMLIGVTPGLNPTTRETNH